MTENAADKGTSRELHWSWAAAGLAGFFLVTSIYISSHRLFWFDEVFSVLFARLPNVSTLWKGLLLGSDLQPMPYYLIVRCFEWIFGRGELAARLPSALALSAGLWFTFDSARRLTNGLYGLLAEAILICSFLPFYGYEARPYAIFFLCSSLLLWVWLNTSETKLASLWAFGILAFSTPMVHFYAPFALAPFAVYDLVLRKRLSKRLLAGAVGMGLGMILLAPQLLVGRRLVTAPTWWTRPSPNTMIAVFGKFFPQGVFLLVTVLIVAAVARSAKIVVPPMPNAERLGWLYLLIPIFGFLLTFLGAQAYYERYFISALPGIAVAAASLLHRQFGSQDRLAGAILAVFIAVGLAHQVTKVLHPEQIPSFGDQQSQTREVIAHEAAFRRDGKPYTAVIEQLVWLEAWYYSQHRERYFAVTRPGSICWALEPVFPSIHCWTMDDLKRHARDSAVVGSGEEAQHLMDTGMNVRLREADPLQIFYLE
jgi:hypothetical protein